MVVQISWKLFGVFVNPVLIQPTVVITSSQHGASISRFEMKWFNLALVVILSKYLERSSALDAATQSLLASEPELS